MTQTLYNCIICGELFERVDLVTRQVRYRQLGQAGSVVKSKNVGNYCFTCMELEMAINSIPPLLYHRELLSLKGQLDARRQG